MDIINFITDSFLLMIVWLLMSMAFFSWGSFFSKIMGFSFNRNLSLFIKIWLGWVLAIAFFAVYNLWLPINSFASSIFYFPAIIFFIIKHKNKLALKIKKTGYFKITAIIFAAFSIAAIAIQYPWHYDTGFYHLNSIRWANEHHIIKGLGNLHTRLGFNQIYFLYAASLNFHPFLNDYAFHAANSFLFAFFTISMILSGSAFDLILLFLSFGIPMPYYWIGNPTPDIASTLLQISAFRIFIEAVYFNKNKIDYIYVTAILSCFMVAIKLSNAVFALGLVIIALLLTSKQDLSLNDKKAAKKTFIFIGLFTCLWLLRGYIQTGYPLFPAQFGKINFRWTVPESNAKSIENTVYAGTRSCERTFDINSPYIKNWNWLDYWFKVNFFDKEKYMSDNYISNIYILLLLAFFPITLFNWGTSSLTYFILSIIFFVTYCIGTIKNRILLSKSKTLLYLFSVELLSILFWFLVAPGLRFANAIFIVTLQTSLLLIKAAYPQISLKTTIKALFNFYPSFILLWGLSAGISTNIFTIKGMSKVEKADLRVFTTNSGLKVLTPIKGHLTWDSPLPSTPEPNPNLSLLGKDISEGFKLSPY